MRIKERLVEALEYYGFPEDTANMLAECARKHVIADIVAREMEKKVRKAK